MRDTVSKAPPWSRVVISDASHLDDTASCLAELYEDNGRVDVVVRSEMLGWVEHANLLLEEASTELFCWMPQDDLVFPDGYFSMLVAGLDGSPGGVLAYPIVTRRVCRGWTGRREPEPAAFRSPPAGLEGQPPEAVALKLLRSWNLGLAWRGVFRTDHARMVPDTTFCADMLWAFSMALAGELVRVPETTYLKRFHSGSAMHSMDWQGMASARRLYRTETEARLGPGSESSEAVMKEVSRFLALYRFRHQYMVVRRAGAGLLGLRRTAYE